MTALAQNDAHAVTHQPFTAHLLVYAAPVAAVIAGVSAEWLDFRALRYPLLIMMLASVAATLHAREAMALKRGGARRGALDAMLRAVLLGVVTWGAAQTVYVMLHVAQGERFDAPRFGPQPLQALALIAAHAVFLGAPTGLAAGAILQARAWLRRKRSG